MAKKIRLRADVKWVAACNRWHVKSWPGGYHLCELYDCEGMVEAFVPKLALDKRKINHVKITIEKQGEENV